MRWLGPVLLAATGARVALAEQFGAYLDKRELQYPFPKKVNDHSQGQDLWFDYVADTGDGFDATYSVAYLLAQPELTDRTDAVLPRGAGAGDGRRPGLPDRQRPGVRGPVQGPVPGGAAVPARRGRVARRSTRCPATTTGTTA